MSFNGNLQPSGDAGEDLTTKGDLHGYSTENTRLPVGADTNILQANSATSTGLEWIVAGGGGGIEQSFTITGSGTTTPTSQTGFKGIIMDMRDVTGGTLTCNVDGSAYLVGTSGNAYALAVNPTTSLNFVGAGAGRQLTTASYVQASNKTTGASSPIGLWCDPTGANWGHGGGLSDGNVYGTMGVTSQWDITSFIDDLDLYSDNTNGSTRTTGCCWRYTGNGTTDVPSNPVDHTGGTGVFGGTYTNSIQVGMTGYFNGEGFKKVDYNYIYPDGAWRAGGGAIGEQPVHTDPIDNDMYGLHTTITQQNYFTTGRQHDKMYKWEVPVGNIFGNIAYIDNSSSASNSGLGICASTTNGDACVYQEKDISAQLTDMVDISFTNDGLWCIVAGASGNLYSYVLTVAYDLTTATYDQTYSTSAQSTSIGGVQVKADGEAVYVLDSTSAPNSIFEYNTIGALAGTARIVIIGS